MTIALRGQVIRFAGDPFVEGDGVLLHESDGAVVFDAGRIVAVGPAATVLAAHPQAAVEDVRPALIVPGFVDCHVHYPQIGVVASYGAQLLDWLERYTFPEEMRFGDPKTAAAAARAFFETQISNGFTTSAAFCTTHPGSVDAYFAEAVRRGVRAVGGKVMMDRNAPAGLCDDAVRGYDESAALIARWHGAGRCSYAITPRFAPTSSPAQLEAAGALWAAIRRH